MNTIFIYTSQIFYKKAMISSETQKNQNADVSPYLTMNEKPWTTSNFAELLEFRPSVRL